MWGLGFIRKGLGKLSWFGVEGWGFRVQSSGLSTEFRIWDLGFRVYSLS